MNTKVAKARNRFAVSATGFVETIRKMKRPLDANRAAFLFAKGVEGIDEQLDGAGLPCLAMRPRRGEICRANVCHVPRVICNIVVMSATFRVYAYLDALDDLRLETQTTTLDAWAKSCGAEVIEIISEPFIKRMKFANLESALTWCRSLDVGLAVARTSFLANQMRFLTRVHQSDVKVFSADLPSLQGPQGAKQSVTLWRLLYEIGQQRATQMNAAKRQALSQRLTSASRQDDHDRALAEEVYYAIRNNLKDRSLALLLNERGRLQMNGNRYTVRTARRLKLRVLKMLEGM